MRRAIAGSPWLSPLVLVALLGLSAPAGAQPPTEPDVFQDLPAEAPSVGAAAANTPVGEAGHEVPGDAQPAELGLPFVTPGADPLHRGDDPMAVDGGGSSLPYGVEPAGKVEGNPDAVVVVDGGDGIFPPGTNQPVPISGGVAPGALDQLVTDIGGFLVVDFFWQRLDNGDEQLSFRPRQVELRLEARWADVARVHVELNLHLDQLESTFRTAGLDRLLADELIEQAYLEWTPSVAWLPVLTLRAGKMPAPTGNEAYDAVDRIELSRASLQILANPDLITGISASADLIDEVSVHLFWFNGWDQTFDGNIGKTFAVSVPHRVFARSDGGHTYEGQLDFVIGVEDPTADDLRWLLDYAATLRLVSWLTLRGEFLIGREEHKGLSLDTGRPDPDLWALFYGGMGAVQIESKKFPLRGSLRIDYVHDRDLLLGIATDPALPSNLTTLVGFAVNLRYALFDFLELGVEYRVDFLRGDVPNVGIRRNFSFIELDKWFNSQLVTVAVLGRI